MPRGRRLVFFFFSLFPSVSFLSKRRRKYSSTTISVGILFFVVVSSSLLSASFVSAWLSDVLWPKPVLARKQNHEATKTKWIESVTTDTGGVFLIHNDQVAQIFLKNGKETSKQLRHII